eukprot:m.203938 g.203938  ORF g.203938 m.203938 type:complete len:1418 (-) comp15000_c0_seq1:141-4394(-)
MSTPEKGKDKGKGKRRALPKLAQQSRNAVSAAVNRLRSSSGAGKRDTKQKGAVLADRVEETASADQSAAKPVKDSLELPSPARRACHGEDDGELTQRAIAKTILGVVHNTKSARPTQFGRSKAAEEYIRHVFKSVLADRKLPSRPEHAGLASDQRRNLVLTLIEAHGLAEKHDPAEPFAWRIYCTVDYLRTRRTSCSHPAGTFVSFNESMTLGDADETPGQLRVVVWLTYVEQSASPDDIQSSSNTRLPSTKGKFLGQVVVKASEVVSMASSSAAVPLFLQKRSPRSTVSGNLALQLEYQGTKAASRHSLHDAALTVQSRVNSQRGLSPEVDLSPTELMYFHTCRNLMAFEGSIIEGSDISSDPRCASDECCFTLEAMAAKDPDNCENVKLSITKQFGLMVLDDHDDAIGERGRTLEYAEVVAWFTYLFKAHFHARFDRTNTNLVCTNMSPRMRDALVQLVKPCMEHIKADLSQYKFRFPAHGNHVPPVFDHVINICVTIQTMLHTLDPTTHKDPAVTVTQQLLLCKKRLFDLELALCESVPGTDPLLGEITLCDKISSQIQYDMTFYTHGLRRHVEVDMLDLNRVGLCQLHYQHLAEFIPTINSKQTTPAVLDLYSKCRMMKTKFCDPSSKHLRSDYVYGDLPRIFDPLVARWVLDMSQNIRVYAQRALDLDTLEPMSKRQLHSSSAVDIFSMLMQMWCELKELQWPDVASISKHYERFAQLVVDVLHKYSSNLLARFPAEVAASQDPLRARSQVVVSDAVCICLNNMAQLTKGLVDLEDQALLRLKDMADCAELDAELQAVSDIPQYDEATDMLEQLDFFLKLQVDEESEEANTDDDASLSRLTTEEEETLEPNPDSLFVPPRLRKKAGSSYATITSRDCLRLTLLGEDDDDDETVLRPAALTEVEDEDDEQDEERATPRDPSVTLQQTFHLARNELANCLSPLLNIVNASLLPTISQFADFLIGIKRTRPTISKLFLSLGKEETKFGRSHVTGISQRRMKQVKHQVKKLRSAHAKWHRHENRPTEHGHSSGARSMLLSEAQIRLTAEPLLDAMDEILQSLSAILYQDIFESVLLQLWENIVLCVDGKVNDANAAKLDTDQTFSLLHFLNTMKSFFHADGSGIPLEQLKNRTFDKLVTQLELATTTTTEIMWRYWETQVNKAIGLDNVHRPSLNFAIAVQIQSGGLHLGDKLIVQVNSCHNLPAMSAKGTDCCVEVTCRLGSKVQTQKTQVVPNSLHPTFDSVLVFDGSVLEGLIHCGVYHVDTQKRHFIGEACYRMREMDDSVHFELAKPLDPLRSSEARALLAVLGSRKLEPDAVEFFYERSGTVLGRGHGTSQGHTSKIHAIHGHHFHARFSAVPPMCVVCDGLILGVGKSTYACHKCGITVHKRCHIAAAPCAKSREDDDSVLLMQLQSHV